MPLRSIRTLKPRSIAPTSGDATKSATSMVFGFGGALAENVRAADIGATGKRQRGDTEAKGDETWGHGQTAS